MQVITVINQKGGSGKTTIATNLARSLQLQGADVVLIDADPQGSARQWSSVNPDNPLLVLGVDRATIARDLRNPSFKRYEYVIIDGAPRNYNLARSAIDAANLVIIPVQPSPYDTWAAAEIVSICHEQKEIGGDAFKAFFLLNRVIERTKINNDVTAGLEAYGLPTLKTYINQRVDYAASAARGLGVLDFKPQSKAAQEVQALTAEIKTYLTTF